LEPELQPHNPGDTSSLDEVRMRRLGQLHAAQDWLGHASGRCDTTLAQPRGLARMAQLIAELPHQPPTSRGAQINEPFSGGHADKPARAALLAPCLGVYPAGD
jgi:hypothetical protein